MQAKNKKTALKNQIPLNIPRVFGYIRVSTLIQCDKDKKFSLETQEAQIQTYCKENNLQLTHIYADPGVSGKTITKRKGLMALLEDLQYGDIYIFTSISRLGRSTKDNITVIEELHNKGCKLVILDLNIDTTTNPGMAMFQMLSTVSEFERKLISQRIKDVMQHMKETGSLRTKPIFGYQVVVQNDKKIKVENPEEQKVILFIKQLRLENPKIKICDIMRQMKVNNFTLRNGKLYREGIRAILKRENL